jgi:preprotein translocase subunit SecD
MESKRNWKAWWTFGLLGLSLLTLLPTFVPMPSWYTSVFDKQLSFGLDLKGGLELRYTVDYKKAISDNTYRLRDGVHDRLSEAYAKSQKKDWATLGDAEKTAIRDRFALSRTAYNQMKVEFKVAADKALLDRDMVDTVDRRFELRDAGEKEKSLFMPEKAVGELKSDIVTQTLDVIRKRVDAFGLVEPDVRRSGDANIDVQLPGLSERQMKMVRERIGQAAQLTFRMVRQDVRPFDGKQADIDSFKTANPDKSPSLKLMNEATGDFLQADKKSELLAFIKTVTIPEDVMIGFEFVDTKDENTGVSAGSYWRTRTLQGKADLTGDNLTRAGITYDQTGKPVVSLEFDSRGGAVFADLTEKNVGNLMAILLDDDINSAPQIRERISGGRAQITLGRGGAPQVMMEEAKSLVTVLNNGAYKAPVIKVHDIEVGPSLGADAVNGGLMAMGVGVLLVLGFMVVYYRQGGLIANFGLVVNLVLQLACLVAFNAALTLPGMAGLTLTVGMAVDANILIFERIREEQRLGRSVRGALEQGYGRTFWTIFDSHITSGMAGAVLMMYSSGPIYGFAVTLLIGIATSMFTSIVVTRMVYDWLLSRGKLQELEV